MKISKVASALIFSAICATTSFAYDDMSYNSFLEEKKVIETKYPFYEQNLATCKSIFNSNQPITINESFMNGNSEAAKAITGFADMVLGLIGNASNLDEISFSQVTEGVEMLKDDKLGWDGHLNHITADKKGVLTFYQENGKMQFSIGFLGEGKEVGFFYEENGKWTLSPEYNKELTLTADQLKQFGDVLENGSISSISATKRDEQASILSFMRYVFIDNPEESGYSDENKKELISFAKK